MTRNLFTLAGCIALVSIAGADVLSQRSAKSPSRTPASPDPSTSRERATRDNGFALEHAGDSAKAHDDNERTRLYVLYGLIRDDFSGIQVINNHLLLLGADPSKLDLDDVSRSAQEVNKRAKRIKSKLALPATEKRPDSADPADGASLDLVVRQIKQLDENITAFVNNPMFHSTYLVDTKSSAVSLEEVIRTSELLRRAASKAGALERR